MLQERKEIVKTETQKMLEESVNHIANDLRIIAEGRMRKCESCGEWFEADGETTVCPCCGFDNKSEFDPVEMYEYFDDALDIEYRISASKEYKNVKILVAFGGPNIYIDTEDGMVKGFWWSDRASATICDEALAQIDEWFEECFRC